MIGKFINKIKKGYEGNKILVLAIVFGVIWGFPCILLLGLNGMTAFIFVTK